MIYRILRFIHRMATRISMWAWKKETYLKYYKKKRENDKTGQGN
jgi:hypothetical protein